MSDSLNVQNEIGVRSIDQPVEGGQNSQVSFRKNDYEHTPYADEVNLKGNENNNSNTGKIVGLGVAALAISSAIYAALHGKNILTKAEKCKVAVYNCELQASGPETSDEVVFKNADDLLNYTSSDLEIYHIAAKLLELLFTLEN